MDTTASIYAENFCLLSFGIQKIVQAINPLPNADTRIAAVSFDYKIDNGTRLYYYAEDIFTVKNSCKDIVEVKLPLIVYDYNQKEKNGDYVPTYKSVVQRETRISITLMKVLGLIQAEKRNVSVVIITDGDIDGESEFNTTRDAISTESDVLIVAGFSRDTSINKLKRVAGNHPHAKVVYQEDKDVRKFIEKVVVKMGDTGALCVDEGTDNTKHLDG